MALQFYDNAYLCRLRQNRADRKRGTTDLTTKGARLDA